MSLASRSQRAGRWAVLFVGVVNSRGTASAADNVETPAQADVRRIVELSTIGTLDAAQRSALVALLEPELGRVGLTLVWSAAPASRERLASAKADRRTLMLATLDVRDQGDWKLIVVDVERRRGVERALPAPGRNAAAAEGVASIIASAAAALREGLEVASTSADEVLSHSLGGGFPESSSSRNTDATREKVPAPKSALQASPSFGGTLATLAPNAPVQIGISASVGVTGWQAATVRLGAIWYEPAHFASPFGQFRIERESLSLSAARRWTLGSFGLDVALGVSGELLRRAGVQPGVSVDARGGSAVTRLGALVVCRGSIAVTSQIAIVVAAGAAWFPRPVQYIAATPETFELTAPWRLVGTGQLEIELRVP